MDTQLTQQLTMLVQQMLQVLQQSGAAAGAGDMEEGDNAPTMDKMSGTPDTPDAMPDEDDIEGMGDSEDVDEMDDEDMDGDQQQGSGIGLHDRISKLEQHTGLKKFAKSATTPLVRRIDYLEREMLGEEYEGTALQRIEQLESAILGKAAKPSKVSSDAPDVIPLEELIKSAAQTAAIAAVRAERSRQAKRSPVTDEELEDERYLPDVNQMRKNARQGRTSQTKRQTSTVSGEEDLHKAAQGWGIDGDLDEPASFGDALLLLHQASGGFVNGTATRD